MTRVMVVDDDENLLVGVAATLHAAGMAVDTAASIADAHEALRAGGHDCVVFDRMLPDGDAIAYVHMRRREGWGVPVLFLTARDAPADRVAGFEHGGDDYLVKPFSSAELTARVQNLCRRAGGRPSVLRLADLEMDCARREVRRAGILLSLTGKEFAVLEYLLTLVEQVVSRSDLLDHCWESDTELTPNAVDAVVKRLRRKLGTPELIHTVHGRGFLLGAR
ncbi:response regulator transcription factor [Actinophytocola sp. NPDC049390]|uniref:response regulator transcription factor n=1 Tax=Actinophytocola sp. NPDC049390 TaxID=3363894 RepID=UPI003795D196